ncbi:MAG: uroporphyrinogen decarboxylase family protein, partial [Planctomycetia bacterium]|nr:uroporphyrinogen decarboxylase family protein [Planctomycetia bacterium]
PKETMTSRERWTAVLKREKSDRVPMDYWATPEATEKLLKHLGCEDQDALFKRLHIDRPLVVGPKYVGPPIPEGADNLGNRYKTVDYGTGSYRECVYNRLADYSSVEEIEADYDWPGPDLWDYSVIKSQIEDHNDRPIQGGGGELFYTYAGLRGQEQAYIDLVENPEIVHYILDKLFALAYEDTGRIFEQIPGKVLVSYVSDDMGSQEGLLCSPAQIRKFFLPRMKRMADLVHEAGAFVFHHNDGAVRDIIPDLIEIGIDVLNPIQWRCAGMEREGLKRDFGASIAMHGGMDNQYTLPFGSVEEVRQEVLDNLRILGAGGGYILAPCHNIQAVGPAENIVAMYEMAYENGWT